jgi:hypothetical protein
MSVRQPPSDPAGEPITPPISTRGIVIGVVVLAALLVAFALWANAAGQRAAAEAATLPSLQILAPANGDSVDARVELHFQVDADLRRAPEGWSAGRHHLHAAVDGQELMPGAADISILARDRYIWTFPTLPPGERTIRLFWSDARHRPIPAGASPAVRVHVR